MTMIIEAEFGGLRNLDRATVEWAKKRGISKETLVDLGVVSGTVWFEDKRKLDAIIFRYEVGFKARSLVDKHFAAGKGSKVGFWGLSDVLAGDLDVVYVVEGEMDRCAFVEAGMDKSKVLAAPGSSGKKDTKLSYISDALKAGLSKVKKFVMCTDNDDAGKILRMQIAHIVGLGRSQFVEWPDKIKDANDVLRSEGPAELRRIVETGRKDWPIDGLYKLSQLPMPPSITQWEVGVEDWKGRICLAPGTMSVVTGQPGHGKTQLWAQLWYNVVRAHDLIACIATFETKPRPQYQRLLRQFYGKNYIKNIATDVIAEADTWIDGHYLFLQHPDQRPTLQWVMDQSEAAVSRHGAKIVQIDPWNRLETQREPGENETDYILRCLRELYQFAVDMQIHVQVLAHPSKRDNHGRGTMPILEDIAGSKHWDNLPDQGFSVWRPRLFDENGSRVTYAELHHLKARFDELGYPSKFGLNYSPDFCRFSPCELEQKDKKSTKKKDAGGGD